MLPPASSCKVFLIPENAGSRALWLYLKEARIPFVLERVKAEDALAKSYELYTLFPDQIPGSLNLPLMRDQGCIVYGNMTILRYLATKHGLLYPTDITERAAVDMFLEWYHNHLQQASSDLLEHTVPMPAGIFSAAHTVPRPRKAGADQSTDHSSSSDTLNSPDDASPSPVSSPVPGGLAAASAGPAASSSSLLPSATTSTAASSPVTSPASNASTAATSTSNASASPMMTPAATLAATSTMSSAAATSGTLFSGLGSPAGGSAAGSANVPSADEQEMLTASAIERARRAGVVYRQTLQTMEATFLCESLWLAGNCPTIADVVAACELAFVELTSVKLSDYPRLNDWYERVKATFTYWEFVHRDLVKWLPEAHRRLDEHAKKLQNIKKFGKDATGGQRPPDLLHRVRFPFGLHDTYKLFLDSEQLTKRLGKPCAVEARKGGEFSLLDGEITGTVLVLVENASILIGLRAADWPAVDRSMTTLTFTSIEPSITEVQLQQADVPAAALQKMDAWWNPNVWLPLEAVLVRDLCHTIFFETAVPHQLYENLMDAGRMVRYTRSKCELNRGVGAEFSLLDGQVTGKNIELITDKKITQLWRCADWPAQHHSTVTIELKRVPGGTDLAFAQVNVPVDSYSKTVDLWDKQFWRKIRREIS